MYFRTKKGRPADEVYFGQNCIQVSVKAILIILFYLRFQHLHPLILKFSSLYPEGDY